MNRTTRALFGLAVAGLVAAPLVAGAAPKKPAKPAPKPAPKAAPKADAKAGQTDFAAEGCSGCHATKEVKGGTNGPDLSKVGAEHKQAEIEAYIMKPKAGSIMPAFKATDAKTKATLGNIVAYLATQK